MTDENKDLNTDQLVADPDLNNADAVDQQGLTDQVADGQGQDGKLADGTSKDKTVKYEDMKKATDRATAAEEKAAHAERTLELYQANVAGQQQGQQQEVAKTTLDQAMLNCGVTADDMFGEAQVRVFNEKSRLDGIQSQSQQTMNADIQFIASHPDITQVVGSVNPATGQLISMSPEAVTLLQKKPHLAGVSLQVAYNEIIQERKFKEYESKTTVNQEHLNRQNADNSSQPLGGSAAGGGGAGDPASQQMMTREQQNDIRRRAEAGEEIT